MCSRFKGLVWEFGPMYQAKVVVSQNGWDDVGIGLRPGKTEEEAMMRVVDWVKEYQKAGPARPGEVIDNQMKNFTDLYYTRSQVLEQIFFRSGSGFRWLDGSVVEVDAHDGEWLGRGRETWKAQVQRLDLLLEEVSKLIPETRTHVQGLRQREEKETQERLNRPMRADPGCNALRFPSRMRKDWKATLIEALRILERRGDDDSRKEARERLQRLEGSE